MKRRMLGLVASLLCATLGTVMLVGYVQSAHDEAAAGEPTEPVLVVTAKIDKGTKAADIKAKVAVKDVAVSTKVEGAVKSASALEGKVAVTDLLPGEQVVADRFGKPQTLGRAGVPKGMLEVTIELQAERVVGGELKAGETVAVLASFPPFPIHRQPGDTGPTSTQKSTHIILHKVLVTNVQLGSGTKPKKPEDKEKEEGEKKEGEAKEAEKEPEPARARALLVTLAMDAPSVERVVFSAEHGTVWLAAEPADASEGGTKEQTRETVYE